MKIGTGEFLLSLVVALIVLGPQKMPVYAKKLGTTFRSLKEYAGTLSEAINKDIVEPLDEIKEPLKKAAEPLTNLSVDINRQTEDIKKSMGNIGKQKSTNNEKTEEDSLEIEDTSSISEGLNKEVS